MPTPSRTRGCNSDQHAFLFSRQVGAALLAIAGVTTMTAAVTDAVRGPQAEIVPPAGDLPSIAAAAYVRTPLPPATHAYTPLEREGPYM
jgi:hypothetical protein